MTVAQGLGDLDYGNEQPAGAGMTVPKGICQKLAEREDFSCLDVEIRK
jgi:hypothetical protein